MPTRILKQLILVVLLACAPLQALAAIPKLAAPPLGERWFSISMDGERVGFGHLNIIPSVEGYRIETEGSVKLRIMGSSREVSSQESYLVGRDLSLQSFATRSLLDGSPLELKGDVTDKGIRVEVTSGGSKKERTLKMKGKVYPSAILNIYPLMKGAAAGKKYRIPTLDAESVKVKEVKVEVVGEAELRDGSPGVHLKNDLYTLADNDVWVDLKGNTVRESVRNDLVVTEAEDEATAKLHLADTALAKRDAVLELSLVKVEPPIERPEQLKKLTVEFIGIPAAQPILQGKWQQGKRLQDGRIIFTMPNPEYKPLPAEAPAAADLQPDTRIPSDHAEIVALKKSIVGKEREPAAQARLLATWVAREIKGSVTDSQSPLETLKNRSGNCQSHARLYTALARAAGIPTRFVSGLVYAAGQGFLYHSWAESYLDGWTSVDPTFGELPANLTHIKLFEGDAPDDMAPLAGMIGKVRANVIEKLY
jgi:transglutaminase-like putative cysteine protease